MKFDGNVHLHVFGQIHTDVHLSCFVPTIFLFDKFSPGNSVQQDFDYFFDSNLFDHIAQETNLYSVQTSGKSINTNAKEI